MNIFQQITDYVKREYSTFPMNNNWMGSINGFGSLNCIYQKTVLPSDTWKLSHNVMVKLPPLISPAFTRIKGIVNTYYCSYASVWNYWNSFISDKPEDVFLSRSLTAAYKGKFVEPCCRFNVISLICKIARGYFAYLTGAVTTDNYYFGVVQNPTPSSSASIQVFCPTLFKSGVGSSSDEISSPTTIVWTIDSFGRRKANLTSNITVGDLGVLFTLDQPNSHLSFSYLLGDTFSISTYPNDLGFSDFLSYFIYQCQECERNLSNHGVPTDLIASSSFSTFMDDYFNLLPFFCESSIWHNFYRDEQNQSPEFDYRETNGCILAPNFLGASDSDMPSGWKLRLIGIPPNVSNGSDYWFPISTDSRMFSVLTGFCLEPEVTYYFLNLNLSADSTNITIVPKSYNGLLCLKYRNFEKDYFTSASVDPNFGGVSVQVPNTIDALRTASKLEEFLEVSASARDFYNFMKHIFGTNPESTRYSRPLLLGTEVIPVQIGEQLQTSQTTSGDNGSPLGQRAGIADGYAHSGTANHFFNEHGHIVSFLSFVIDSQYMQGLPHEFFHHLQLDYPFPQFANLGAESIPLKEIYCGQGLGSVGIPYDSGDNNAVVSCPDFSVPFYSVNSVDPEFVAPDSTPYSRPVSLGLNVTVGDYDGEDTNASVRSSYASNSLQSVRVFGYTPRYSRWKFAQDVVAGQLRDSLEFWHTFRHFSNTPYISNAFVSYQNAGFLSNLNRIFAVVNDNFDKFVVDIFNNASVRRCLPLIPQTTLD